MRHKTGLTLLVIGGICMIISETRGSIGVYEFLYELIINEVHPNLIPLLTILLEIIRWISRLGGGAVIIGVVLIIIKLRRVGKWIIGIGLTFGTLALIIWIISTILNIPGLGVDPQIIIYFDNNIKDFFTFGTGLQFIGVTIAIIGRWFIRKPKKEKEEEKEIEELEISEGVPTIDESALPPIPSESNFCPNCGTQLPLNVNYCTECGATFDR